jgi:hypothetical protein
MFNTFSARPWYIMTSLNATAFRLTDSIRETQIGGEILPVQEFPLGNPASPGS